MAKGGKKKRRFVILCAETERRRELEHTYLPLIVTLNNIRKKKERYGKIKVDKRMY